MGIVEGSCGYGARGVGILGKFALSSLEVKYWTIVLATVIRVQLVNPVLPIITRGEVPLVRVDPLPRGRVSIRGKVRLIETRDVNGHNKPMHCAPSSGTPRESQAKFRDGTVWGLLRRDVRCCVIKALR